MKQKNLRKILSVGALTVALCATAVMPAFAQPKFNGAGKNALVESEEKDVEAAITKRLEMGERTDVPNAQFTFEFNQVKELQQFDSEGTKIDVQNVDKPIGPITIDVNGAIGKDSDEKTESKVVEKESSNFLAGMKYEKAGIYVYDVAEKANTYNITDPTKEFMTYSKAAYRVFVYVANKSDDSGETYIKAVGVLKTADDKGENKVTPGNGEDHLGSKVDPTPNPNPDDPNFEPKIENSKMKFTNQYLKINGGDDPEDPAHHTLAFTKKVTGSFADHTKEFDFKATLTKSVIGTAADTYTAYVVDTKTNKKVVDPSRTLEYTFTSGQEQAFKLKHNETLAFVKTPVGTHFEVTETDTTSPYKHFLTVTLNNVVKENRVEKVETGDLVTCEKTNKVDYENQYEDVTPTGIIMNNLSFVMMIALAILAFAGYVVIRGRKHSLR